MKATYRSHDKHIQTVLLLFWAAYISFVLIGNTANALKALGVLPASWLFVASNFELIQSVIGIYHSPSWLAGLFFALVILWQGAGVFLLWKGFIATIRQTPTHKSIAYQGLTVSLSLWAAFLVADEFFLAYEMSGLSATHFNLLIAEIATFVVFRISDEQTG